MPTGVGGIRGEIIMRVAFVVSCLALVPSVQEAVSAEDYPSRPLRFIVTFPPGGGGDLISRLTATPLGERLGQSIIVDNRPGGNGAIGAAVAARSTPDGYTLLMVTANHVVLPSLQSRLPYDLIRDFSPVIHIAEVPNVLMVRNALPVSSVADLIALAKKNPGQIKYGTAGVGGPSHLSGALFTQMTGIKMLEVPYKGTGPVMIDMLGGHIDLAFATAPGAKPFISSGRLKALAVTGLKRAPTLPDLPTVDEAGVKGFEFVGGYGIVVPSGTPRNVVEVLHRESKAVLQITEVRRLLEQQAVARVTALGPAEFAATLRSEMKRWAQVIAAANIKVK